jgi:hypothetical protein
VLTEVNTPFLNRATRDFKRLCVRITIQMTALNSCETKTRREEKSLHFIIRISHAMSSFNKFHRVNGLIFTSKLRLHTT